MVVSVNNRRCSACTHFANVSGPSACSFGRRPGGGSVCGLDGATGSVRTRERSTLALTSGRPLTVTSPRYDRILFARSRGGRKRNNSGGASLNYVVAPPDKN